MPGLGVVQTVVVCIPGDTGVPFPPCPAGTTASVTSAYLIAPSESAAFDLMAEPFDAATAGAYFGFAFASTVFVWLLALGAGSIIKMVRSA